MIPIPICIPHLNTKSHPDRPAARALDFPPPFWGFAFTCFSLLQHFWTLRSSRSYDAEFNIFYSVWNFPNLAVAPFRVLRLPFLPSLVSPSRRQIFSRFAAACLFLTFSPLTFFRDNGRVFPLRVLDALCFHRIPPPLLASLLVSPRELLNQFSPWSAAKSIPRSLPGRDSDPFKFQFFPQTFWGPPPQAFTCADFTRAFSFFPYQPNWGPSRILPSALPSFP